MPAALPIDRVQVQMLALEVGVREAARMLGLPESTVQAWSAREGWLEDAPRSQPLPPTVIRPATAATKNPVEAYKQALAERGNKSRMSLAIGLGNAADRVAEMPADAILAQAQDIKAITGSLSTVHSWQEQGTSIKLNLGITSQVHPAEAEVLQDAQAEELP